VTAHYATAFLGVKRVALLLLNNDYGMGLEQVSSHEFTRGGAAIVTTEWFHQGDTDFRTQLAKIRELQPDAVYIVGYPEEMINILQQAAELGIQAQILATSAFQDAQILENAGPTAEGVVYPYPIDPDPTNSVVEGFGSSFREVYSKAPGIVADTGYDAVMMIAQAIETTGGTTGSQIREGLESMSGFQGASGKMSFDANGDIEKEMVMKVVRDGAFTNLTEEKTQQ
jgi:branched-chain amino acid transport system substrate-binding protein